MIQRFRTKFYKAVKQSLTQGTSPEKLSLTITLGILLGIIPIIGVTTLLLAILAIRLKLNMIVIQLANYAVYPLQLLLLIPFFKMGQHVFKGPHLATGFQKIYHAFVSAPLSTLYHFWQLTIQGTAVWIVLSIPAGFMLYCIILIPMRKLAVKSAAKFYRNLL